MEEGVSRFGELPALYELEAGLCYCPHRCDVDHILGGGKFWSIRMKLRREQLKGKD